MKTMLGDVEKKLSEDYVVYVGYYGKRGHGEGPRYCLAWVFPKETRLDDIKGITNGKSKARPLAVGESHCHPKDNFWKKKGRHIAVCRAAKALGVL